MSSGLTAAGDLRYRPHMNKAWVLVFVVVSALAACKGKKDNADMKWPDKPADGTPVAMQFLSMKGAGDRMEAHVRFFNFADKAVTGVRMELHYQGADGKDLKTFPYGVQAPGLIGAKDTAEKDVGAFIPADTKNVTADISEVDYADGPAWKKP